MSQRLDQAAHDAPGPTQDPAISRTDIHLRQKPQHAHRLPTFRLLPSTECSKGPTLGQAFRRFQRKQVRRFHLAAPAVLFAMLGVSLLTLAMVSLKPANTLWSQELTLNANVATNFTQTPTPPAVAAPGGGTVPGSTGTCSPAVTYTGVTVASNQSTYTYTLTGADAPRCNPASYVALPVCFEAALSTAGKVIKETHHSAFAYAPGTDPGNQLVRWSASSTITGPYNASFSFTVPGMGLSMEQVQARWSAGGPAENAGLVWVPRTADCLRANTSNRAINDLGDEDSDGVLNFRDNCLVTPNGDQADLNNNGIGDICEIAPDAVPAPPTPAPAAPPASSGTPVPAPAASGTPAANGTNGTAGGYVEVGANSPKQSPFSAYEDSFYEGTPEAGR